MLEIFSMNCVIFTKKDKKREDALNKEGINTFD